MRRLEREGELAQRNDPQSVVAAVARAPTTTGGDARKDAGDEPVKVGAEAFVARGNGSSGYAQPDWDTDETLEAYIAKS